jgi:crossover junction endodeoxyribonuclease RuvC
MPRLIGLDPGLRVTGWGVVEVDGNRLAYVASGVVSTDPTRSVPERLVELHHALNRVLQIYQPDEAAVEETFVNRNARSTLKLGLARGVALLVPALAGLPVAEYAANLIKKSVVGAGHAEKDQIAMMVRRLLPGIVELRADAADALAVAICHAHIGATRMRWSRAAAVAAAAASGA